MFLKPILVNLISKDANLVFFLSVYSQHATIQVMYEVADKSGIRGQCVYVHLLLLYGHCSYFSIIRLFAYCEGGAL